MKSENGKTWLLFLLIVTIIGSALFFPLRKPKEKTISELNVEFDLLLQKSRDLQGLLALTVEYDELLTLLTKDDNGLDSSTVIVKTARYYDVKQVLKEKGKPYIDSKDDDVEGFQRQVKVVWSISEAKLVENKEAIEENLKKQATYYMQALSDKSAASEKIDELTAKRDAILAMNPDE